VALGRLEVHESLGAEALLSGPRADQHLAIEDDGESVLMDLMLREALARRQGEQDHPVGLVV
jgi:hypothetical protein